MRFRAALIGAVLICGTASAAEKGVCPNPTQMQEFKTCADVAKAEQEGEVVIYATNPEQAELKVLARFSEMFPKIKRLTCACRPVR
jgi:iron(III) transport system substrate-binding protein